jgi:transposase
LLHNWQKALEADGTISKAIEESPRIDAELKRLREENRQLKIERDILKKATAFFAKESS